MAETTAAALPALTDPAGNAGLLEVFRRRYLLSLLVRRELSARYQGSVLGMLWSYVNPLSQFCLYYFLMAELLDIDRGMENFAIHMFAGLIVVHLFVETMTAGTRSIVRNRKVIQKMALPREMFPVASMLVSVYHALPQFVILIIACLFNGWQPSAMGLLAALLGVLMVAVLGTAIALVMSVLNVYLRDASNAVNVASHFIRFGVPMIYPYSLVVDRFGAAAQYYLWNPLADAVLLIQRGFWAPTTSDVDVTLREHFPPNLMSLGLIALAGSVLLLIFAQWFFAKFEAKIPERL